MTLISPVHILFIAVFALIFLGPKRLPELARGLGTGMREFRHTLNGDVHHRDATAALTDAPGGEAAIGSGDDLGAPPPVGPFA